MQNEFKEVIMQDLHNMKDEEVFEALDTWIPSEYLVNQVCSPYAGQLDWREATHVS